jgi:hypothetical protein
VVGLGSQTEGESTYRRYGDRLETQNLKVFDIPTAEELIQKP